jgi:hypothetical protein
MKQQRAGTMTDDITDDRIDAVITWVDGRSPAHRAKRARFMARSDVALHENAINPHRWEQSDEIYYCLQSIHTHAPWLRKIWIVVDEDAPDLTGLGQSLRDKVCIVQHREIFLGYESALPTFNSLTIESMLWRIEGLAERFLYFNDDVFLTAPLKPRDVFDGEKPVLRGEWVDYAALRGDAQARSDPALFNHYMLINAASLCGMDAAHLFACAHVVHPLRRSVMAQLFAQHHDAFMRSIRHRFRDLEQFSPQGLHTQSCLMAGSFAMANAPDHCHITSGQGVGQDPAQTRALLTQAGLRGIRFLCVNDLPQLVDLVPEAPALIARAVGMPEVD